jgi:hypothetical protein
VFYLSETISPLKIILRRSFSARLVIYRPSKVEIVTETSYKTIGCISIKIIAKKQRRGFIRMVQQYYATHHIARFTVNTLSLRHWRTQGGCTGCTCIPPPGHVHPPPPERLVMRKDVTAGNKKKMQPAT